MRDNALRVLFNEAHHLIGHFIATNPSEGARGGDLVLRRRNCHDVDGEWTGRPAHAEVHNARCDGVD